MKKFRQIIVLTFAALIIISSFNYSSVAIVIVILENEYSTSVSSSTLVTNASHFMNITGINDLIDYITISIINVYEN